MTRLVRTLVLATMVAAGCGGGGGSGPAGVDGTKQISAVNDMEKASLCDWFAAKVGGYGTTPACPDAFLEAPPSKAECLADFPSCAVTVSQFESCVEKIVAAQNACTQEAFLGVLGDANCQTVENANCFQ